jgi:hypothetical protein
VRDIAEQFQRWVKQRAAKRSIPIMEAPNDRYARGLKPPKPLPQRFR